MYELSNDGDDREKKYNGLFLKDYFPAYEEFWQRYVVRLTGRPHHIHFRSPAELSTIGCGDFEVQIAQLHYSVLVNLAQAWEVVQTHNLDREAVSRAFSSLVSALDVAAELLGRISLGAKSSTPISKSQSERAREHWETLTPYPNEVASVRRYRNSLEHGHALPNEIRDELTFPKIGCENKYRDWRTVTTGNYDPADFAKGVQLVKEAWEITIRYLQEKWENDLLKHHQVLPLAKAAKSSGAVTIVSNARASEGINLSGTTISGSNKPYVVK